MFIPLREGRVLWRRCAQVHLRYWHSGCMANHADLVVNGAIHNVLHRGRTKNWFHWSWDKWTNLASGLFAFCSISAWMFGRQDGCNSNHDVLKPGTCKHLIGRHVRVGLLRSLHGIVIVSHHTCMVYCLWESNRVPLWWLCMGSSVWLRFFLTEPLFHKATRTLGTTILHDISGKRDLLECLRRIYYSQVLPFASFPEWRINIRHQLAVACYFRKGSNKAEFTGAFLNEKRLV